MRITESFYENSSYYAVAKYFLKGINIFLVPIYTNLFSTSDYGVIDWLTAIASMLFVVLGLQLDAAVGRYINEEGELKGKQKLVSTGWVFVLITGLIPFVIVCISPGFLADLIIGRPEEGLMLLIWSFTLFLRSQLKFNTSLLKWLIAPKRHVLVTFISSLLSVILSIIFVIILDWGLIGVFLGQLFGVLLGVTVSYILVKQYFKINFEYRIFKKMLNYSWPLVFSALLGFFLAFGDRFVLVQFMSLSEVGLYGVGFRFSKIVILFFEGVSQALTPLIFKNLESDSIKKEVSEIFSTVLYAALTIIIFVSLFSKELLYLFANENYVPGYIYVPFVCGGQVFITLRVFAPGFQIAKKNQLGTYIVFVAGLFNLLVSISLVQVLGPLGVGIGTLASAFLYAILWFSYSNKHFKVDYRVGKTIIAIVVSFLLIGTKFVFYDYSNYINVIVSLIIITVWLAFLYFSDREGMQAMKVFFLNRFRSLTSFVKKNKNK
ncbi:MAG: oligosaccharide flippase family protein [Roseivirga sp.]